MTGLSARVRGHTLLHVELPEGRFLVDASVGGLPLAAPVMMDRLDAQPTPHEPVRLMPNGSDRLLQAHIGDEWVDVYRFDLAPHLPTDLVQKTWHRDPPELAVQQPPRS